MLDPGFGYLGLPECTARVGVLVFNGSTYSCHEAYDYLSVVYIHSIASVVPFGYRDIAGYLLEKMTTTIVASLDSDTVGAGNSKSHFTADIIEGVDDFEACVPGMGSVLLHLCQSEFRDIVDDCEVHL